MLCKEIPFIGPFKHVIPEFIEFKRGLGYDCRKAMVYRLAEIDRFFYERGITEVSIPEEIYMEWAIKRPKEGNSNRIRRIGVLSGFARYLHDCDYEGIFQGEGLPIARVEPFQPYIFTTDEISQIYRVIKKNCISAPDSRDDTFAMLFSLYYGCGFRLREGLDLRMSDVDLKEGRIRIIDGKNHVSRMVPLSQSIKAQLERYIALHCIGFDRDSFVFRQPNMKQFTPTIVYRVYHKTLAEANIQKRGDGKGQRIHDLRHTFCVHSLECMGRKGFDLYTSFPIISIFLGHKSIVDAEYYLRLTNENLHSVQDMCADYTKNLFPSIEGGIYGK
jgi:integrase